MTGWILFKKRLLDDYKYQRKVISIVVDWIVLLYIFLPAIIIGGLFYIDIWRDFDSYWFNFIPSIIVIGLLFLLGLHGSFRTFMLEADILFLLDRKKLYQSFRGWTFLFSLVQLACSVLILIGIFLPFLVQGYGLGWKEIVSLFFVLIGFKMVAWTLRKVIRNVFLRWAVLLVFLYMTVYAMTLFSIEAIALGSLIVCIIFSIWHIESLLPTKRFFVQEVANENKERVRYAKLILGVATEVEKTQVKIGKHPLILRDSRRLFHKRTPENGLLELLLKGFIRNPILRMSYFQIISITLFGILFLPFWGKWLLFTLAIVFLQYNSWLKGLYEKLLDQHFFSVIPIDKDVRERVWLRFKRWLMFPAIGILGLATLIVSIVTIIGGV